jgi:hypothetical protein
MNDFLSLTCPNCGGKLEITADVEQFACGYCGNEQIVRRGGGIVRLEPMIQQLQRINSGTDRTASELAISRLTPEINGMVRRLEEYKKSFIPGGTNYRFLVNYFEKDLSLKDKLLKASDAGTRISNISCNDLRNISKYYSQMHQNKDMQNFLRIIAQFLSIKLELEEKVKQLENHRKIVAR